MRTLDEFKEIMADDEAVRQFDRELLEYMVDTASKHDIQNEIMYAFFSYIREGNDIEDSVELAMTEYQLIGDE